MCTSICCFHRGNDTQITFALALAHIMEVTVNLLLSKVEGELHKKEITVYWSGFHREKA
jgi:hypothetical protein